MIQEAAIKCRFCGSLLNGAPAEGGAPAQPGASALPAGAALLVGSGPQAAAVQRAPQGVGAARVVYEGTPSWKASFWTYVLTAPVFFLVWPFLNWSRKSTRFRITDRTIDVERGIFSKVIDTLQLWRVRDLEYRQTLLERLLGIARILVYTTDKTDPELVIAGLPASRELFERLKDSAEIARQQRVVGLVE
jgi:uncharacterized membrane protein YdbT with pleckstrin-like domain